MNTRKPEAVTQEEGSGYFAKKAHLDVSDRTRTI